MADVAGKTRGGDGPKDGRIVQLLVIVQFVASGDAGRVIVAEPGVMVLMVWMMSPSITCM